MVTDNDEISRVVRSRHVTFDESQFPGAHYLHHQMDEESLSHITSFDEDIGSNSSDEFSVNEVDDVISNSESGTSDPSDAANDTIAGSALSNADEANKSSSKTEESNHDDTDLGEVN